MAAFLICPESSALRSGHSDRARKRHYAAFSGKDFGK
jgi:hypothetical protein